MNWLCLQTTRDDRSWLIDPFKITHIWLIAVAIAPALLATILVFLDQQITAVIVNRKEHKLKVGQSSTTGPLYALWPPRY